MYVNVGDLRIMATFETRILSTGEKRFRARITLKGFPRKSQTFTIKKIAKDWAREEETKMRDGRSGMAKMGDHHTAAEMIDDYIRKTLPYKTKKQRYIRQQTQQLLWWKKEIGKHTLSNLTKPLLIEKRDKLKAKLGPATVNRYLAALSHVFTVAIDEWEWLETSPLARVKRMKEPKGRIRYLKDDERPDFLKACMMEKRKPLFVIAVLIIACGARKEEITAIPLKNVDVNRGMATTEETKNSEPKTFFITGFALQLLRKYVEENKYFKRKFLFSNRTGKRPILIDKEFRRACDRAGIDDFTVHSLRHTHASYLAMEANADAKTIAESLNQKSLTMANRYTHLSKGYIASKVEEMNNKIFGD